MNNYEQNQIYAEEAGQIVAVLQQFQEYRETHTAWPEDARLQQIVRIAEEYFAQPMGQLEYEWFMEEHFNR